MLIGNCAARPPDSCELSDASTNQSGNRARSYTIIMWGNSRLLANFIQGGVLIGAVYLASFDVKRTMHQKPVTPEQNAALLQHLEKQREQSR